jgi:DNA replication factor GINS
MAEKEINITYETLFELLRREKNREELQKLDKTFFPDIVNYLKEKESAFEQLRQKQDLFAAEEKKKAEKQLENIKKILKELYEKREKKIIEMSLDASRTNSAIDTSAMLNEEKMLYENAFSLLNKFRENVLLNLQHANLPEIKKESLTPEIKIEEKTEIKEPEPTKIESNAQMVKFVHAVPSFVGPDLKEYGPFEEGNSAELPNEVAEILINKGRAE